MRTAVAPGPPPRQRRIFNRHQRSAHGSVVVLLCAWRIISNIWRHYSSTKKSLLSIVLTHHLMQFLRAHWLRILKPKFFRCWMDIRINRPLYSLMTPQIRSFLQIDPCPMFPSQGPKLSKQGNFGNQSYPLVSEGFRKSASPEQLTRALKACRHAKKQQKGNGSISSTL